MTANRDDWDRYPPAPTLLLRVKRPDHEPEEFYVEEGLTIGRSRANTIVLSGDDLVARFHARVEADARQRYRLVAVSAQSGLQVSGKNVPEVMLDDGVRFQLGSARCICLAATQLGQKPPPMDDCMNSPPDRPVGVARGSCHPTVPAVFGTAQTQRVLHADETGIGLVGLDQATGQPVRIEWFTHTTFSDPHNADSLSLLARLRCSVRHRNLVGLREAGVANNCPFLIWDWIDRPSLQDIIADYRELGSLPHFADVVPWIRQMGSALGTLEHRGMVVTRLDNTRMLMDQQQQILVVDCLLRWPFSRSSVDSRVVSSASPHGHWAPCNGAQTAAPHLQCLGELTHELLTTQPLVGSKRTASILNSTVPAKFDAFIARCLRGNAQRYVATSEAMTDFEVLTLDLAGNGPLGAGNSDADAQHGTLVETEIVDDGP